MEMEKRSNVKEDPQDKVTIEDWKRDTEETRAIWEMFEQDKIDKELLQKAEKQVSHFTGELEQGIETRKKTISMLQSLAGELAKPPKGVEKTYPALSGTWFRKTTSTLGAASSLADDCVAMEIVGAEIAGTVMEDTQKILDKDKLTLEAVHKSYSKLVHTAEKISAPNPKHGAKEHVLCSLLMSSKLKGGGKNTKGLGDLEFTLAAGLLIGMGAILTTASTEFGALISRLASRIGCFAGTEVAGEGVASGAEYGILAFNIYELVKVPQDIQTACTGFEGQLGEMEGILKEIEEIEKHSEELWGLTKKEFRELLENIARKKRATREEVKLVLNHLEIFQPSEEWWQAFRENVDSLMLYVSCMAHIFIALGPKVEEQKKKDEEGEGKTEVKDIVFIAHGKITSPKLRCTQHYMSSPTISSPGVKSITLYEPWGCAIDAKAAYGIATDLININNVQYSDLVLPQLPFGFNTLPYDNTPIPMAVFTPMKTDEEVYRELQALATTINATTGRLVIPYFRSPSDTSLPEIPLWALANDLDVIGRLLDIRINLHVAACLTTRDQSLVRQVYPDVSRPVVDCDQYCTVPVTQPPARMSCTLPIPAQYGGLMATLDKLL